MRASKMDNAVRTAISGCIATAAEARAFWAWLEEARAGEGMTRALVIVGPPGCGKSLLLEKFISPYLGGLPRCERTLETGMPSPDLERHQTWMFDDCRLRQIPYIWEYILHSDRNIVGTAPAKFEPDGACFEHVRLSRHSARVLVEYLQQVDEPDIAIESGYIKVDFDSLRVDLFNTYNRLAESMLYCEDPAEKLGDLRKVISTFLGLCDPDQGVKDMSHLEGYLVDLEQ